MYQCISLFTINSSISPTLIGLPYFHPKKTLQRLGNFSNLPTGTLPLFFFGNHGGLDFDVRIFSCSLGWDFPHELHQGKFLKHHLGWFACKEGTWDISELGRKHPAEPQLEPPKAPVQWRRAIFCDVSMQLPSGDQKKRACTLDAVAMSTFLVLPEDSACIR